MRTYCKNTNIEDPMVIEGWVALCCYGKMNRTEFKDLMREYGGVAGVAHEIARRISARCLDLKPIRFFDRWDDLARKMRTLGVETAMQQCMDYVAVGALLPMFEAKIGWYQCASIPGRGQLFGVHAIERWVNTDWTNSNKYVKADVYHCYESIEPAIIEKFLKRDIKKNPVLQWFTMELVSTFANGLSIGSYLSQYLCNYLLSYAYHYATEQLYKVRRNVRKRLCHHVLFYMDDLILLGSDKRDLKMAIKRLNDYLKKELHLTLKPKYSVKHVESEPIDMMGYVVHRGYTTIRARVFLRARRTFIRAWRKLSEGRNLPLHTARRITAYAGYFLHTNSIHIRAKLHFREVFEAAKSTVSYYAKNEIEIVKRRRIKLSTAPDGQLCMMI